MNMLELEPGRLGRTLETVTVAGVRLNRAVYGAGTATPEHVHPLPNLCVTLIGTYEERWGRHSGVFDSRTAVVKPPGIEHTNRFGPEQVVCLNVEFEVDSWNELGGSAFHGPSRLNDPRLLRVGRELEVELAQTDACSSLAAQGLVLSLAATAMRALPGQQHGGRRRWLERVRERLHSEFTQNLRLDDLARDAGVHPAHLTRRFRQRFGCSIGDYVRRLRVEAALNAIRCERTSLAEIARECGFSDQSHMGRVLRRHTGKTPGAWRTGHPGGD